eukprot:ctg_673.g434
MDCHVYRPITGASLFSASHKDTALITRVCSERSFCGKALRKGGDVLRVTARGVFPTVNGFIWCAHLRRAEAAVRAGEGVAVFKRRCRKRGIARWPFRLHRSLDDRATFLLAQPPIIEEFESVLQGLLRLQHARTSLQNKIATRTELTYRD